MIHCVLLAICMLFSLNTSIELAWYSVLQIEGHNPLIDPEIILDGGHQYLKCDLESNWRE